MLRRDSSNPVEQETNEVAERHYKFRNLDLNPAVAKEIIPEVFKINEYYTIHEVRKMVLDHHKENGGRQTAEGNEKAFIAIKTALTDLKEEKRVSNFQKGRWKLEVNHSDEDNSPHKVIELRGCDLTPTIAKQVILDVLKKGTVYTIYEVRQLVKDHHIKNGGVVTGSEKNINDAIKIGLSHLHKENRVSNFQKSKWKLVEIAELPDITGSSDEGQSAVAENGVDDASTHLKFQDYNLTANIAKEIILSIFEKGVDYSIDEVRENVVNYYRNNGGHVDDSEEKYISPIKKALRALKVEQRVNNSQRGKWFLMTNNERESAISSSSQKRQSIEITSSNSNEDSPIEREVATRNKRQKSTGEFETSSGVDDEVRKFCSFLEKVMLNVSIEEDPWAKKKLAELKINNSSDLQITNELLGRGGFANVYRGRLKGTTVAVKRFPRADSSLAVKREIIVMKYLNPHPTLLNIYGYTKPAKGLDVVLEYAPYGALSNLLYDKETFSDPFPAQLILAWLCDMTDAIKYIHSKQMKHRDIKAQNFLVFPMFRLKMADFGIAKTHGNNNGATTTYAGTPGFIAPEISLSLGSDFASDIFSFAVTAIQVMLRKQPDRQYAITQNLERATNTLSTLGDANKDSLKCILSDCLKSDPSLRPKAEVVHRKLDELLSSCGGDPRYEENSGYSNIRDLENMLHTHNVALHELTSEQAFRLLVDLGCNEEKVKVHMKELCDGYLSHIDKVEILQALEGDESLIRRPILNKIYTTLKQYQEHGVPPDVFVKILNGNNP